MIIVRNAKIVKIVGTLCLLLDCVEFVHKKGTLLWSFCARAGYTNKRPPWSALKNNEPYTKGCWLKPPTFLFRSDQSSEKNKASQQARGLRTATDCWSTLKGGFFYQHPLFSLKDSFIARDCLVDWPSVWIRTCCSSNSEKDRNEAKKHILLFFLLCSLRFLVQTGEYISQKKSSFFPMHCLWESQILRKVTHAYSFKCGHETIDPPPQIEWRQKLRH